MQGFVVAIATETESSGCIDYVYYPLDSIHIQPLDSVSVVTTIPY